MKETKREHYYFFYGRWLSGYGPSMDPHRCGHEDEPCVTIDYEREVTEWAVVKKTVRPLSYDTKEE